MKRKDETNDGREVGRLGQAWSRRQFALAGLAVAVPGLWSRFSTADTAKPLDPRLVKLFTRDGAGGYGGESWADAMPIEWLSRSLAQAAPGSTFLIGFEPDKDEVIRFGGSRVQLQVSGSPDQPIVIQAGAFQPGAKPKAGLQSAQRTMFTSNQKWSIAKAASFPPYFFAFIKGASNARVSGFRIDGTSADGFFKFGGRKDNKQTYSNISFSDIQAANVGRVIETQDGALLDHVSIVDCSAKGIVRGFARFFSLSNAVFKNLDLDADNFDGGGKNVCQIISIEAGENIEFENVTVKNALNEKDAGLRDHGVGYIQGDGIVCEGKTRNITLRKCHAAGMGDGGFDLKTTDVTMEDCSTEDCKFGARFWSHSNNVVRRSSFRAPHSRGPTSGAGMEVEGSVEIHDSTFEVGPGTSAFDVARHATLPPGIVKMFGGSIQLADGAKLASGQPGGTLELHDVSVNGKLRNETYVFSSLNRWVY
jgi:hypothetical protein